MVLMLHQVLGRPQAMVVVEDRETIPTKMRKSLQNEEISLKLGGIQGEFCQSRSTEFINNKFLMIYEVLGRPQAMNEVGVGIQFPKDEKIAQ